jgi:hypothetical protein
MVLLIENLGVRENTGAPDVNQQALERYLQTLTGDLAIGIQPR